MDDFPSFNIDPFQLCFEMIYRKSSCTDMLIWKKSAAQSGNSGALNLIQPGTLQSDLQQERDLIQKRQRNKQKTKLSLERNFGRRRGIYSHNSIFSLSLFLSFIYFILFLSFPFSCFPSIPSLDTVMRPRCSLWTVPVVMGQAGRWAAGGVWVPGAQEEVCTLR